MKPEAWNRLSIVREAMEALTKCDGPRLEQILCDCGSRISDRSVGSKGVNAEDIWCGDLEAFARLLDVTRENMRIVRQVLASNMPLEYLPIVSHTGSKATE
jgi:hypothetical protein